MFVPNEKHLGLTCEHCNDGNYINTLDYNVWWVKCDTCGAYKFCYEPMLHQEKFHEDSHKFRQYAGGFGSAKTSTCAAEFIIAALDTPGGAGLIGAQTYPQLENTAKLEFKNMLTKELIANESIQKNNIDLINGYRVMFRSFDQEDKIRSLNLCHFWIEESSTVSYEIFAQLQTRLRNNATDKHFGILSTNPEMNWIKTEFLLKSDRIEGTDRYYRRSDEEINKQFSTHIAKTSANRYLPSDFYETVAKGKPKWYIERYLEGSFEHTSGAVYPGVSDHVVKPFEIPKHWERLFGVDFGLRDPTVMLGAAVDPKTGTVYIYDEHYESEKPVSYHAEKMNELVNDVPAGRIRIMVADPAGKRKSERDQRSLFDHYGEYGLFFEPGMNRIEDGVMKTYTYFQLGKLKIFNTCKNTVREIVSYKYQDHSLDSDKNLDEKPIDKDNHTCDVVRYICMELPDDPSQLINKSYGHDDINYGKIRQDDHLPYALQDDDDSYSSNSWHMYY